MAYDTTESTYESLIAAAIRFVSYRPRSEKEIRYFCERTLKRHHTTAPLVVDNVIGRLSEYGYVDDMKFARWWLDQRRSFKPRGVRVIRTELAAKGIPRDIIDDVLAGSGEAPVSERDLARSAVAKKITAWHSLPYIAKKRKMINFLTRRGFDPETVYSVVDDAIGKE